MKIEPKFDINEKVKIPELEVKGKISGIFVDSGGMTYRVRYFDKAERREVYFTDDEIEKIN